MGNYAGFTLAAASSYDQLGRDVAGIGDVNGDGFADFLVGAPYADSAFSYGAAYVVFGGADGPARLSAAEIDGSNGFLISRDGASADGAAGYYGGGVYSFGSIVGALGDVNGDGVDDFAVAGATRSLGFLEDPRSNAIFVIFGRNAETDGAFAAEMSVSELDGSNGFQALNAGGILGDIEGAGDVNGDGIDDFLISQSPAPYGYYYDYGPAVAFAAIEAPGDPAANLGYVVFGASSLVADGKVDLALLDGSDGFAVVGERSDGIGYYGGEISYDASFGGIAALGDIDGDGFGDVGVARIVVSQYDGEPVDGEFVPEFTVESRLFVLFGRDGGAAPFAPAIDPVVVVGDGNVEELFWGGVAGTFGYSDFSRFYGSPDGAYAAGDINGDGFADVAVGLPNRTYSGYGADGERAIGLATVYFGGPDRVSFNPGGDRDVNGDGISDGLNLFGSPRPGDGNAPDLIILKSDDAFNYFGANIAAIGDVNGDGIGDLAIAAPRAGDDLPPSVYVIFGQASWGVTPTVIDLAALTPAEAAATGYRISGDSGTSFYGERGFGAALSAAGDLNGDGVDDFIIGNAYASLDGGGRYSSAGEAYVVFGGAALEAADRADGLDDSIIDVSNLAVDVDTGVLPIEISVANPGAVGVFANEGNAGVTTFSFEVRRTGDLTEAVGFDYEVAGFGFSAASADDFAGGALPSGTVSFAEGAATAIVEIEVQGDTQIEPTESFAFTISNPTGGGVSPVFIGADQTLARIFNDDFPVSFFARDASVTEGQPGDDRALTFTVQRTGPLVAASVDFAIGAASFSSANAADFEAGQFPQAGTLNFGVGETSKTVTLNIAEDLAKEGNERVSLTLSNADAGGAAVSIGDGFAIGTIVNDDFDPEVLASGGGFVFEGDPGGAPRFVTFTLERRGDLDGDAVISYQINPSPSAGAFLAVDDGDFVGGLPAGVQTATILDGETSATVSLEISADFAIEPNEGLVLEIVGVDRAGAGPAYDVIQPRAFATVGNDDGRPPIIPPGVEADVFGDPHIVTLDGLGYDFQAVGEYILVETLPDAVNPFQVQVRFEPLPGSDLVSVTTRAAVTINGVLVEIDALGADALLIDGVAPSAEALALGVIDVDGDGTPDIYIDADTGMYTLVLNDANEQLMIKSVDGLLNVCVFLSSEAGGNAGGVRGLMGDANGVGSDDLALRDGTVLPQPLEFATLYGAFADSWRLDGSTDDLTPAFSNATTFPENFPAGQLKIDDLPADLRAAAEAAVLAAQDPDNPLDPAVFDAAVLDFALTGNPGFIDGALGLAAEQTSATEPENAPALPLVVGVADADGGAAFAEGDAGVSDALFSFYRIGEADEAIVISYEIGGDVDAADLAPGTALSGTVTLAVGQETATLAIGVAGDLTTEADEALTVRITGTDSVTALVGAASATRTVLTDDFAPVAADDVFATNEDTAVVGNLLAANPSAADSDADGDAIAVVSVTDGAGATSAANGAVIVLPSGASLTVSASGDFTFSPFGGAGPDTDFDRLSDGEVATETFSYRIADGNGGFDEAQVSIGVIGINDAPETTPLSVEFGEDETARSLNLLGGAEDAEGDALSAEGLTVTAEDGRTVGFALGTDGTLTLDDGQFEDLAGGATLTLSAAYAVSDGALSAPASASLTIVGANDAPTARDDDGAGFADAAFAIADVRANDVDPDTGDVLRVAKVNGEAVRVGDTVMLGSGAKLTVNADGAFDYDPNGAFDALAPGAVDDDSFVYTVADAAGGSSDATVTLAITGVAPPPPEFNPVLGGSGSDRLVGTDGRDEIVSGAGAFDRMTGGLGGDVFVFSLADAANGQRERDEILDFEVGVDTLRLEGGLTIDRFIAAGSLAVLTLSGGDRDQVIVRGADIDTVDDLFLG